MQPDVFRYDPVDPESRRILDRLLQEFGVSLPEFLSENFSQLFHHLIWRKAAPSVEDHGSPSLLVFLDLGEGDEVQLLTIRAGEISTFRHADENILDNLQRA